MTKIPDNCLPMTELTEEQKSDFKLVERDGRVYYYLADYNVCIATFDKGCGREAKKILDGFNAYITLKAKYDKVEYDKVEWWKETVRDLIPKLERLVELLEFATPGYTYEISQTKALIRETKAALKKEQG